MAANTYILLKLYEQIKKILKFHAKFREKNCNKARIT